MVELIVADLKVKCPILFEDTSEEQISVTIGEMVKEYIESGYKRPKKRYTSVVYKIIRKHVKRPKKLYVLPAEKVCTKCRETKQIQYFTVKSSGRPLCACKKCVYDLYIRPSAINKLRTTGRFPRAEMVRRTLDEIRQANNARNKKKTVARAALRPAKTPKIKPVKIKKEKQVLSPTEARNRRREAKRRYKAANPEKASAERKRHYNKVKDQPRNRIAKNLRKRLKEFVGTGTSLGSFSAMVGCSKSELVKHLEGQFQLGMTWDNYGFDGWHIDHIRPMASFDIEDKVTHKLVNHWKNLQPMWKDENHAKGSEWNGVKYVKGKPVGDR